MPEEKERDRENQVAALLEKLAGHQVFGRRRGTFGGETTLSNTLKGIVDNTSSPTEALRQWDALAADVRVILNLMATLKRDGHDCAVEELAQALAEKTFMFTGENTPIEETTSVVLCIPGAEQTLTMLQWIITGHWIELNNMLDTLDGKTFEMVLSPLVRRLFALFPSLEKETRTRRAIGFTYEGPELTQAHDTDVVQRFPEMLEGSFGLTLLSNNQYNDHLELYHPTPIFGFIQEGEQSQVLARYPREIQSDVATWQFHIPTRVWQNKERIVVEIYHESLHEQCTRDEPTLTSRSVNHGFGARMVTCEDLRGLGGDNHNGTFSAVLGSPRLM